LNGWVLNAADVGPLGAILVALVATVGALAIHFWTQRRRGGGVPSPTLESYAEGPATPEPTPLPPRPEGLPDWSHADNPLLDIPALEDVVLAAATKAGIDPDTLPRFTPPDGNDGAFVFRDKFDYIYAYYEHGGPMSQQASAVADELAYRVIADRAWMKAYLATIVQAEPGRTTQVGRDQEAMLAAVDPAWAKQAAWEREVKGSV